ncbi:trypsin, alkaline C-like [Spodoptera litura]|uniref:Trypsin, alkaline C-like n=1 Tax=Spodoptera litura TaxID=69820 RepID=A0A9J7INJ1_SPOLT|nr:trypsin, alkaline C-like [Spodoptera litura]
MRAFALITLCLATVAAIPTSSQRIVGGTVTTIDQYPSMVAGLIMYYWGEYGQWCGGSILNNRSVLSAAHCFYEGSVSVYRFRLGSSWAHSGGIVHNINGIILHPLYYPATADHDICILRSASNINYNELSRPAPIAGTTYIVPDNDYLWAAGWGAQYYGDTSEADQLRHVKVMKIGLETCQKQYAVENMVITDKMLCSGWPTGGRDQCQGDSGSPIFHHGVVVGVCSFGYECGRADFPGVNMRVASYTNWILDNA